MQVLALAQDFTASVIDADINPRRIALTRGLFAIVDAVDYKYLSQWKWYPQAVRSGYIAIRVISVKDRKTTITMHREVAKRHLPEKAIPHLDHRNGNKLDNRWLNLYPKKSMPYPKAVYGMESLLEKIQREKIQFLKGQRLKTAFLIAEAIATVEQPKHNAAQVKEQLEEILRYMKP